MKAKEARIKYFEDYVEFEFLVRRLARQKINDYKTNNISLRKVIDAIGANAIINIKDHGINVKTLKLHINTRNWLSHRPNNASFNGKKSRKCRSHQRNK